MAQAVKDDDELFIALGAFALAYCLLLGGNGTMVPTADLRFLVCMATTAMATLDVYNMTTAVLGIVVRLLLFTL